MRYQDIGEDLGGRGNGAKFKMAFEQQVARRWPGASPSQIWEDLWNIYCDTEEDPSDEAQALGIIDWFIDECRERGMTD